MGTRSKLSGGGVRERERVCNERVGRDQNGFPHEKEAEGRKGTETREVKIKEELIEESLKTGVTEIDLLQTSSDEDSREYLPNDEVTVLDKTRGTCRSRNAGLIEKKRANVKHGTGKRWLQGGRIPKRNKKYFQDIRNFATKLSLNQVPVPSIQNGSNDDETSDCDYPEEGTSPYSAEASKKNHSKLTGGNEPTQCERTNEQTQTNKRSSLTNDEEPTEVAVVTEQDGTKQRSDTNAKKTNDAVARSKSSEAIEYSDEEFSSGLSHGAESDNDRMIDLDDSSSIDYKEMLKSYDITSKARTTGELLNEYDDNYDYYKDVATDQTFSGSNTIERTTVHKETNRKQSTNETRTTESLGTEIQTHIDVASTSKVVSKKSQTNEVESSKIETQNNQYEDESDPEKMDWDREKIEGEKQIDQKIIRDNTTRTKKVTFDETFIGKSTSIKSTYTKRPTGLIPIRSLQPVERGYYTNKNTITPQFKLIAKASSSLEQTIKQRGLILHLFYCFFLKMTWIVLDFLP